MKLLIAHLVSISEQRKLLDPDLFAGVPHGKIKQLGTQPLLYISLGTVFNNQADFYRMCFAAFADTA
jgi:UDP:flavonoid glycosyltransferase YjiC (YdhE family)